MYKLTATETHNQKATEFETKALLYLMNYHKNSKSIHWVVVDFFNDVTGVDNSTTKCFDVQSKGIKEIQPTDLGRCLVTLFKNYLSELNFEDFVLFIESVSTTLESQVSSKDSFTFADLNATSQNSIISGLKDEANKKTYIENKSQINDSNIKSFLRLVTFVKDSKTKEEYIKDAVSINSSLSVEDLKLRLIFKEIRDLQSTKKNNDVDGKLIENISGFLYFDKGLKVDDIQLLILNRICFKDFLNNINSIPIHFVDVYNKFDETIRNDRLEDCSGSIMRVLMDKNNRVNFWNLFEEIVAKITENKDQNVEYVFSQIDKELLNKVSFLDDISAMYLIALLKERITDD